MKLEADVLLWKGKIEYGVKSTLKRLRGISKRLRLVCISFELCFRRIIVT